MRTRIAIASLLAIGVGATGASAQEDQGQSGGLTRDDVQAFIDPIPDDANSALQNGEWDGVATWLAQNVADDAPVAMRGYAIASEGPTVTFEAVMTGADLEDYARRMGVGSNSPGRSISVEDYSLETEIMGVWQVPDDMVSAAIAFYESGRLTDPEGGSGSASDAGSATNASAEPGQSSAEGSGAEGSTPATGVFSAATICSLRLGGPADDPVIQVAACEIKSMF